MAAFIKIGWKQVTALVGGGGAVAGSLMYPNAAASIANQITGGVADILMQAAAALG